jgi:prevent-host-death family protein
MKTASAAKGPAQFDEYLDASQKQPVLVTRNGKPVAVLMAVRDKAEADKLASPRSLRSIFQQAHQQIEQGRGIAHEQFWKQVAQTRAAKPKPGGPSPRR